MSVLTDIVYPAQRLVGILGAAGRSAYPEADSEALDVLNALLDDLNTQRLVVYQIQRIIQNLTAGKQAYQVGIGSPDWNIPRPSRVENASLLFDSGAPQILELPLRILNTEQWQDIPIKAVPSPVPSELYYDAAFPFGIVNLWPFPSVGNQIALYLWLQLTRFGSLGDAVSMPPGYLRMLQYNLAVDLEPRYPRAVMKQSVWDIARSSLAHIKALNMVALEMDCDPGLLRYPPGGNGWGGLVIGGSGGGTGGGDVLSITITGTINGTTGSDGNPTFLLSISPSFLQVYKNGLLETPGTSYTLAGNVVTFLPDQIPLTGDVLLAFGR